MNGSGSKLKRKASEAGGQPPTYLFGHGAPDGQVVIRTRSDDGTTADVLVDGQAFGLVLSADNHYRQAIEKNSRTTVSALCYGDASAEGMTERLWNAGIDTDVYSFKIGTIDWSPAPSPTEETVSTLTASADTPAEEKHLANPITHRVPPGRQTSDSP